MQTTITAAVPRALLERELDRAREAVTRAEASVAKAKGWVAELELALEVDA